MKIYLSLFLGLILFGSCKQEHQKVMNNVSTRSTSDSVKVESQFISWAKESHIPIHSVSETKENFDLEQITKDLGEYKVVVLSEGFHNCKETLSLHHRLIKYLVEHHGFNTVVTESGLPESRLIYDYIQGKPVPENHWKLGINKMYGEWQEGRDLVNWMKSYNASHNNELEYYGIDIGGFYKDWKSPMTKIITYLKQVDRAYGLEQELKWAPYLEILKENARKNYFNKLTEDQQYELALYLGNIVDYFDKHKEKLIAESDLETYEWNRQSTIAMQLAENYYRQLNYRLNHEGISDFIALNGREIAMSDNLNWVLNQRKDAKVIVINHVLHTKTKIQNQGGIFGVFTPAGYRFKQDLRDRIFTIGMSYGGGQFWNKWQTPEKRFVDHIPESPTHGIEQTLAQVTENNFYIDWSEATSEADPWLNHIYNLRENDYFIKILPNEWDACIFLHQVNPATAANSNM